MASIEVMKERARIAGRFNLSARRNPEYRALVALAAQRAGGECHVIPAAPAEKVADVFRRSRIVAGESAVIITEINGTLYAQIIQAERVRNLGQDSRGVTTVASASDVTQLMKSNKYVPVGMLFLILAIILNVVSNVSDLVLGILYGISIAVLIIGLFNSRK
ncbi:hypothetical protein [Rothia mucilaginosa]|uniref:hypothetical protein n=1 Tax=Rothia mucilaginosa TaxID=43675 RepID=UPI0028E989FE|nr:hypothetical protein [Rothia mucilaginosa]